MARTSRIPQYHSIRKLDDEKSHPKLWWSEKLRPEESKRLEEVESRFQLPLGPWDKFKDLTWAHWVSERQVFAPTPPWCPTFRMYIHGGIHSSSKVMQACIHSAGNCSLIWWPSIHVSFPETSLRCLGKISYGDGLSNDDHLIPGQNICQTSCSSILRFWRNHF